MENRRLKFLNRIPLLVKLGGFLLFFGILGFAGWLYKENKLPYLKFRSVKIIPQKYIYVHISGEVKNPGLYKVEYGARIGEVVDSAGGLTRKAALSSINFAAALKDGQKIVIPARKNIFEKMGVGKGPEEDYINPPIEVERAE